MCEVHKPEKTRECLMAFFFEAMKRGWITSARKMPIPHLPGSKTISFQQGNLLLLDYYFVCPGSKVSYGTTVIWIAGDPVWIMHYGGWYDERVIPFLKRALARNYSQEIFLGGRGPEQLEGEDHTLLYLNETERNNFADFKGHEEIITTSPSWGMPSGTTMGEHSYFGGLLI